MQTGGNYYDAPPSIRVLVIEDPVVIPAPKISPINLPVNGFSLQINIDMDKFPPYSKILVES